MTTVITVESLSKSYLYDRQIVHALRGVSLEIAQGDIFGIIGLSGAGKSTLIRCLATLVAPTSGRILFHDQDIAQMPKQVLRAFRRKIGMIFQHFNLLSARTVAENISYPLEIAKMPLEERAKRVDELLALVGLLDKKDAYPARLSGGEKQRVGIARALANRPEVLLCDEATSALDPKTTREILNLLKNIHRQLQVTIVLITHEMGVIKHICNKVAVIDKGGIVEEGLIAEVFGDPQHPITKHFLQAGSHEIPREFFKGISPHRKLVRLTFKGQAASEPIVSDIVRKCHVDANILLGWIDRLATATIGTLVIELIGNPAHIANAFAYLREKNVHYEVIEHESQ